MRGIPVWATAVFAVILLLLLAGGAWFYRSQEQRLRLEAERNLQAISELKIEQIVQWRAERLADGAETMEDRYFKEAIFSWLSGPRPDLHDAILSRFRSWLKHRRFFDVLLVDGRGDIRLSLSGRTGPINKNALPVLDAALKAQSPVLVDLHTDPAGLPPHLDVISPLFPASGKTPVAECAIIMQSDAREFLYPLIQAWPVASKTAETLLVRREGDQVLFLNDARHRPDTVLEMRIALDRTDVPSVQAVLGGTGVVEGPDYRGIKVLASLRAVPDSPWFIIAKIDKTEALAGWRLRSTMIVALILAFAWAVAGVFLFLWQRKAKAYYRALYNAEAARSESEERYRTTLMSIGDAVIATDAAGLVQIMNPVAESLTGWGQKEAVGQPLREVFRIVNEGSRQAVEDPVALIIRAGLVVGLANHTLLISRDGVERPIADAGAPVRNDKGETVGVVLVFRDQTLQRRSENALRESGDMMRSIFRVAPTGIGVVVGRVFLDVNTRVCEMTGYSKEELIGQGARILYPTQEDFDYVGTEKYRQIAERGSGVVETRWMKKNGDIIDIILASTPIDFKDASRGVTFTALDITDRKRNEEKLRMSLQEREILLREVHHRVKNNIQIVSSLLRLQSRSVRDEKALDALNECQNRIRSIALIHEKLYQSQDFARVDFSDYIENMVTHLISFHSGVGGRVSFRLEADDVKLDINRAIPCGLIVNELVTNVLKHAFPEGRKGDLLIRLKALDEGRRELVIKDTGVGLADDIDLKTADTLGFQIVVDLVKQLEGTIEVVRGSGTEIIVRF